MRRTYFLRKYGMPIEALEALLQRQNERCAICHKRWTECALAKRVRHEARFLQYLYVDHDHATGDVRGLLCNGCNTAIGMFEEDPMRFRAAATYLASRG
jgi:Recombination endonuclease VII